MTPRCILLTALLASIVAVSSSRAETNPSDLDVRRPAKKNNLTTNPLLSATGIPNLTLSRAVSDHVTIDVSAMYSSQLVLDQVPEAVGGGIGVSFFRRQVDHGGLFTSVVATVSRSFDGPDILGVTLFAPGVYAGKRWTWSSGLNISLAVGFLYGIEVDEPACPAGFICTSQGDGEGLAPKAQFEVGYLF
jgi:hypothetical protein